MSEVLQSEARANRANVTSSEFEIVQRPLT
jgi:hypothetical protein